MSLLRRCAAARLVSAIDTHMHMINYLSSALFHKKARKFHISDFQCTSSYHSQPIFDWTFIAQRSVHALSVVEQLYIHKQIPSNFINSNIFFLIDTFSLGGREEAFDRGIVIRTTRLSHASDHIVLSQHFLKRLAAVLRSTVTMENSIFAAAVGINQCIRQ